ncbi:hypothetical protein RHOER0001_5702 [Rhodococcus erythropolis SK121]|nr:hypothetical protein RHOER0001_5702 [Rhodococcus erythropolis SK121]
MAPWERKFRKRSMVTSAPEWRRLSIPAPGESAESMFPTDPDTTTSAPD